MVGMTKNTSEKVEWMKEQYSKGISDKHQLKKLFMSKYGNIDVRTFYNCWSYLINGTTNRINLSKENDVKRILGDKDKGYFGEIENLVEHHISYNPEIVVKISAENHHRLHMIIDQYHILIKEKDRLIREYERNFLRIINLIKNCEEKRISLCEKSVANKKIKR